MPRPSRKVKPGERSYLLTGIPAPLWEAVTARAAQLHIDTCVQENRYGQLIAPERCHEHAMKPILLGLLKQFAQNSSTTTSDEA